MKRVIFAALSVAAPLAMLASAGPQCDSYSIAFSKDVYLPGETAFLTITGEPGTVSWLGFDNDPGPTLIPGIGEFNLGFSSSFLFAQLPPIPAGGSVEYTWSCSNPCTNPITGTDIYVQGVALDPITMGFCISNVDVLNVEDLYDSCASQGCTPGYWKNHTEDWAEAGLSPSDDFDTIFGVDYFDPDQTLLEALDPSDNWTFGAHAVAALLNAQHPGSNYDLLPNEIKHMVQDAAAGTFEQQEELKDMLDHLNNSGCPF